MLSNFLEGKGSDSSGRKLSEYYLFNDNEMENIHDYIQWMFPTNEKSKFNYNSPVLEKRMINKETRKAILRNLNKFWDFIFNFENGVFNDFNHNHLRITRVIHCLRLFELNEEANLLYIACSIYNKQTQSDIYWKKYLLSDPWEEH